MPELDTKIIQHRQNATTFNRQLSEAVGFSRQRPELFGKHPDDWKEVKEDRSKLVESIALMKPITIDELQVDNTGMVLQVINIQDPYQFEFETADLLVTQPVSVVLLLQDTKGSLCRAFVYNYALPSLVKEYLEDEEIQKLGDVEAQNLQTYLPFGCKIKIANPELKTFADGQITLVVNDPVNLEVEKQTGDICAYCFKGNAVSHCGRCKKAHYCSKTCQSDDWKNRQHKLICITKEKAAIRAVTLQEQEILERRPEWIVYVLEFLCYQDYCPALNDPLQEEVRRDYGFAKCHDVNQEGMLLGLYQGLIKIIRVDMVKLHNACCENTLEPFIRACFEAYGGTNKGAYYEWFLQNPSVVHRDV